MSQVQKKSNTKRKGGRLDREDNTPERENQQEYSERIPSKEKTKEKGQHNGSLALLPRRRALPRALAALPPHLLALPLLHTLHDLLKTRFIHPLTLVLALPAIILTLARNTLTLPALNIHILARLVFFARELSLLHLHLTNKRAIQ